MKRSFMVCILTVLAVMFISGAALAQEEMAMEATTPNWSADRNQISFSLGTYYPSDDMDDEFNTEWENGADLTASYTRLIGSHFAFEAGLHVYGSTFEEGQVEGTFVSSGTELLFYYVPIHTRVMPYLGGGIGFYSNSLLVEVNGTEVVEDEGSAAGIVLKGGLRFHVTRKFYLGGFYKVFSNNQEFEYENGDKETINMGGSTLNFELGFAF